MTVARSLAQDAHKLAGDVNRSNCPVALQIALMVTVVVSLATPQLAGFGWSSSVVHPVRTIWGDFDGDGHNDQLAIEHRDTTTHVRLELSSGAIAPSLDTANSSSIVSVADVDGDGDVDIVTASPDGSSELWLNDGLGRLTLAKRTPATSRAAPLTVRSHQHLALLAWRPPLCLSMLLVRSCEPRAAPRIRAPSDQSQLVSPLRSTSSLRGPPRRSPTIP